MVSTLSEKMTLLHMRLFKHFKGKCFNIIPCFVFMLSLIMARGINAHGQRASSHPDSLSSPKWHLTVSDPHHSIRPGLTIIYVITYENRGSASATEATLVSTIDPLTEYLLSTGAGIYDTTTHNITWNLGTVEPHEGGRVILRTKTQEGIPNGTEVINTTVLFCAEGIHRDTTLTTPITYLSILKIYKTAPVTSAFPGQEILFDIHCTNIGDTSATNVLLTDPLPDQTRFISCTQGCLLDSLEDRVYWEIGDVQPGSLFAVQLRVRIDSTFSGKTSITNKVLLTSAEETPDSTFCTITVDTTAKTSGIPDFSFVVKGRDHFVSAGNEILYRVCCENIGRETAHTLTITNPIPEHTDYLNCNNNGHYDSLHEKVTWYMEELERHQEMTATLTVRVKSPLPHRIPIVNRASVTCTEGFSASAVETTIVLSAPKWDFSIRAIPHTIIPGQPTTFTTTVRNIGSTNAVNTVVINPIPLHTSYVSHTNEGGFNSTENVVTWNIGQLNVNEESTVSLTIAYDPDKSPANEIVNSVSAQSEEVVDSVSISLPVALPQHYQLGHNYPNPFNQSTTVYYQLPTEEFVLLKVYNILGQDVRTLVNELKDAGYYYVNWDGMDDAGVEVTSGVYYYQLSIGNGRWTEEKSMVLLR